MRSEVGCASKCAPFVACATIVELPTRCALWCTPYNLLIPGSSGHNYRIHEVFGAVTNYGDTRSVIRLPSWHILNDE
jgi:hypothetical protein